MPKDRHLAEAGETKSHGRCEVCGREGEIVFVPRKDPPNRFCLRCAVEYGDTSDLDE